jgi:hypothetical protein
MERTVGGARYVWVLTRYYFVISQSRFGLIRCTLVKFVNIRTSVACSTVRINYGLFFGRAAACKGYVWVPTGHYFVTISLSHTLDSVACDYLLSCSFDYVRAWLVLLSESIGVGF